MRELLADRAADLAGCLKDSNEEAALARIADVIHAYDRVREGRAGRNRQKTDCVDPDTRTKER